MPPAGDVLLDTGVLVALLLRNDAMHGAASNWLARRTALLHTTEAVLTEAAFFVPARQRPALADFACRESVRIHRPDDVAFKRIGAILHKYSDLDPDWADATLVWLAEQSGIRNIATLDQRDFSTFRIHGRSKFMLEPIA